MVNQARLGRKEWMQAARLALLKGGPSAVRVETLAKKLCVSKGSFYWHFKNRAQLLEVLLREWEEEKSLLFEILGRGDMSRALKDFFRELETRCQLSERGRSPSDAAIFAWAAVSPKVARRANKEETARIQLLKNLSCNDELGEYIYMAYLGFLMRRRRVPDAARNFPILASISSKLLLNSRDSRKSRTKLLRQEMAP
jgi:AcrR family transcriptional regulator